MVSLWGQGQKEDSLSTSVFYRQLLISHIFPVYLKCRAFYITGQWGEITVNNATSYLHTLS